MDAYTEIQTFFDKGLLLEKRLIYLGNQPDFIDKKDGEIGLDYRHSEQLIKSLFSLEMLGTEPITIYLNSNGGNEEHGLAMYDAIKQSKCFITIVAIGHCESMATVVFQAADQRIITPNCSFMMHLGTIDLHNLDQRDMNSLLTYQNDVNRRIAEIYGSRTKGPIEDIYEMWLRERYFSSDQVLALGLADEVWTHKEILHG